MEEKEVYSKHTKKGMFRGLRQTQQTVDLGSQNNSLDIGSGDTDEKPTPPDEPSVPMIVEHLAESSAGESDSEEGTDGSEVPLTDQDKEEIDREHTHQGFSGPLPRSTSFQSIKMSVKMMQPTHLMRIFLTVFKKNLQCRKERC